MKLTTKALEIIKESPSLQAAIAEALDVRLSSVARYIRENDDELTKAASIIAIEEHSGLTRDEILEKQKA